MLSNIQKISLPTTPRFWDWSATDITVLAKEGGLIVFAGIRKHSFTKEQILSLYVREVGAGDWTLSGDYSIRGIGKTGAIWEDKNIIQFIVRNALVKGDFSFYAISINYIVDSTMYSTTLPLLDKQSIEAIQAGGLAGEVAIETLGKFYSVSPVTNIGGQEGTGENPLYYVEGKIKLDGEALDFGAHSPMRPRGGIIESFKTKDYRIGLIGEDGDVRISARPYAAHPLKLGDDLVGDFEFLVEIVDEYFPEDAIDPINPNDTFIKIREVLLSRERLIITINANVFDTAKIKIKDVIPTFKTATMIGERFIGVFDTPYEDGQYQVSIEQGCFKRGEVESPAEKRDLTITSSVNALDIAAKDNLVGDLRYEVRWAPLETKKSLSGDILVGDFDFIVTFTNLGG